jgi:hypothetical protein
MRATYREYCQQLDLVEKVGASVQGDGLATFPQGADKERKNS